MHLTHYIAAERQAEETRRSHHEREALRQSGACWSGMGPGPFTARTEAQIVADATARFERAQAAAATPEGRFRTAASLIFRATGDERLLNCSSRGIDTNADLAADLLRGMDGPAADAARAALAEMAVAPLLMAAE